MVTFIDQQRQPYGVESICRQLPIAPSTYFRCKAVQADPAKRSARAVSDAVLKAIIQRIWTENDRAYGVRKVWKQMGREGLRTARCRVRRLMRALGVDDHDAGGHHGGTSSRSGRPALHRDPSESALGLRLYVCRHVARLRLRRVRD